VTVHVFTHERSKENNVEMTTKNVTPDLCVVKNGLDCLRCSHREERLGIEIIDDYGGGGFNFFICEECLQKFLNEIKEQKKSI